MEVVRVEQAAERPEPLLEVLHVEVQPAAQAEEREVVAVAAERQDPVAARAEVHVHRRAGAAVLARVDGNGGGVGLHIEGARGRPAGCPAGRQCARTVLGAVVIRSGHATEPALTSRRERVTP